MPPTVTVGDCVRSGGDDRIMDANGAHRLYQAAVNAKREMLAGLGHPQHNVKAGGPRGERAARCRTGP